MFLIITIVIILLFVALYLISPLLAPAKIDYTKSHILITGGSSGIGQALAINVCKKGSNITLFARNMEKLIDSRDIIKTHKINENQKINVISVDLTKGEEVVEEAVNEAVEELGPIDALFNCAGSSFSGTFDDTPISEFKKLLDLNYIGSILVTKAVLPAMKRQGCGRILFVSSQAGQLGVYGYSAYSGSKFALRGVAESLQMEVKLDNIYVTLSFPPDTDTPGYELEMKSKPRECQLISEASGIYQPDYVAKRIIKDVTKGKFLSHVGLDGMMLSVLTCGMSPVISVMEATQQVKVNALGSAQCRNLNLQEFQSKRLMQENGISVQKFKIAETLEDASRIASEFAVDEYVIKAQILAGGRGKGVFNTGFKGGVHLTKKPEEISTIVGKMLGNNLTTKQTTPEGVKVMIAEALDIERETYLAIVMDRENNGPVIVGSPFGGMDIEQVAETNPDAIYKMPVDITSGLVDSEVEKLAANLGFTGERIPLATEVIRKLYDLFLNVDATQIEINPFAETPCVVCFDAKINFDDNAAFRQKSIFALDSNEQTDAREIEANKLNLTYIGMDGSIGCLVNGAGLAMATMDLVSLHGGRPANFLDCGGGVTEAQVEAAFNIISSDNQVKAILVNVFGGIVNCETIAKGIIAACKKNSIKLPVVVRLEGMNVKSGLALLNDSGLKITTADSFDAAAAQVVKYI